MYTEQDYRDITGQLRQRAAVMGALVALLLVGVMGSFGLRAYWFTVALTILLAFFVIFFCELLLRPVAAYRRHLDQVLHGRVRTATGVLKRLEEKAVERDGVSFYPLVLNVGDKDAEEDDRLFYYDASLPLPPWQIGETLTVTAHDKALGAWSRV